MPDARASRRLVTMLKQCLKIKGMTYRGLAESMNLSESSVRRLFASGTLPGKGVSRS